MVTREIKLRWGSRTQQRAKLGIVASIGPGTLCEILLADDTKVFVDLMTCQIKKLLADVPQDVAWELTRPNTWTLELCELGESHPVINDASCDFTESAAALVVRQTWLDNNACVLLWKT